MTRPRSGRVVRALLFVATLGVGVGLAAIPVGTWMDQRDELDDARRRQGELQTEIDGINADIQRIIGEEGLEEAALCYGQYVEPGEEVYGIPGLQGCITGEAPD